MKVALGIGGLLLVGGAVWFFTRKKEEEAINLPEDVAEERPDVTVDYLLNLPSVKDLGITRKDVDEAFPKDNQDPYGADAYAYMNQSL